MAERNNLVIKKVIGDNSLPDEAGPIRSATEFVQRVRELISDQAGGLGRLYAESVIPSVQRVVDILEKKQILSTSGLKIDQFLIEVRMTSPLAKGEAMQEVENIVRFIEMIKMLGGDQMVLLEVDPERSAARIGDLMDVPRDIRTTKAEKKLIKEGLTKMAAAEAGGDPNEAAAAMAGAEEQLNAG